MVDLGAEDGDCGLEPFATLDEAEVAHERYRQETGRPGAMVTRLWLPCVKLSCHCGAYALGEDDDEQPCVQHFGDPAEAIEYAAGQDMAVTGSAGREYLVFDAETSWQQRLRHRFDCASLTQHHSDRTGECSVGDVPSSCTRAL